MATKAAVTYDGTNDYAKRGAGLTGAADSKMFTLSFWIKRAGSTFKCIMQGTTDAIKLVTNSNFVRISAENAAGSTILDITSATNMSTGTWQHVMMSFDMSNTSKRHLYIDGVSSIATVTTYTNDTIDFTLSNWSLGAFINGSSKLAADLSQYYLNLGTYIDLSQASNRAKFYVSGKAPNLGANGQVPTGSAPIVFADNGNPVVNTGGGGNYTMTGAVVSATGPVAVDDTNKNLMSFVNAMI